MTHRGVLSSYSYSVAAVLWAAAVAGTLAFALVSGLRHVLWLQMMHSHPAVPLWLWAAIGLLGGAIAAFWYRMVSAAIHQRRQLLLLSERIAPLLRPFPLPVQGGALAAADWHLLDDRSERYAFTWGGGRPQIGISLGLWEALDGPARRAVMYHEAAHALAHDPLQQALLQVLAQTLQPFGMQALYQRYLLRREVAADALALSACGGDDRPLLTALLAAATGPAGLESRVGLAGALEARIRYLDTGQAPPWWDQGIRNRLLVGTAAVVLTFGEGLLVLCR